MASRYHGDPEDEYHKLTHGGEEEPTPLRSRRLVDVMEPPVKGTGKERSAAGSTPRRHSSSHAPVGSAVPQPTPPQPIPPHPPQAPTITSKASPSAPSPSQEAPPRAPSPALRLPPDTCAVLSVSPAGEGELVNVVLAMPSSTGEKPQRVSLHLLVEQYAELGIREGEITLEAAEATLDAGRLCGAIRRGIAMLGYGDQSARRLMGKLIAKGVDREIASRAVSYLTRKGYIHEDSTATLRAEQGLRKGWGPRRIREDLSAHGFTREAVEEAMASLSDVDWEESCAAAIRKKYRELPEDKGARQKLVAAVMRLGYDADTVKSALRRMWRET